MQVRVIESTEESFNRAKKVLEEGVEAVQKGTNQDYFVPGLLHAVLDALGAFERDVFEMDCEED